MAEVDNKVVSITFDNASFEKKMNETIASLDKLRQSLDLAGAKKGLTEISEAGKKFNLDPMNTTIEGTSAKFIAMTTVGVQALTALVGGAARAGLQFAKSLSITPIMDGFSEFELKMGSIQTIMAGSGASLDVVNQKLNELNTYSDKTIYSFSDMTSNIGKFTNAGVDLDKAVGAIQGVANVAALSGANAEEASRAMFNFGQALGQGSVKAIDWKSIELANMGTVEFKKQLIDAAVAMGTLTKAGDGTFKTLKGTTVTTGNFATTLQDAWLSSDVLTTTLNKFSDTSTDIGKRATKAATQVKTFSQMISTMKESVGSGWAQSFENIFGNFDEGTKLWTRINDAFSGVVGASADARNQMLLDWKNFGLGGRNVLIESLATAGKGLLSILRPIHDAFRDIFPKKTAADLLIMTARFSEFVKKIKIGGETAEKIKVAFRGFFAILGIGWEILKNVVKLFFSLAAGIWKIVGPLLGLVGGTGELATGLHAVLVKGEGIDKFFEAIIYVLNNFFEAAHDVVEGLVNIVVGLHLFQRAADLLAKPIEMLQTAGEAIKDFFSSLKLGDKAGDGVKKTGEAVEETAGLVDKLFAALKNVFGQIGDFLAGVGRGIAGAFKGLGGAIADALGSGNFNQVLDVLKVGLLGGILVYIRKFFKNGLKLDLGQGKLMDSIRETFETLTGTLKSLQAQIRANTLIKIATAVGILTIAIIALSLVDAKALAKAMAAITAGFAEMTAVMLILEKTSSGGGSLKIMAMATGMMLIATAMALLVIPIKALSKMDMGELMKGLLGVSAGMLALAGAVKLIGSDTVGIVRAGAAMILISVALIVLAKAIKSFAAMNLAEMGLGLAQAALGIALLIQALKRMPDDIGAKGVGLLILALALRSLARVVQLFAGISFPVLAKGFLSISAGLYLIGKAMQEMPDDMLQKSVAMIALSGALWIMAIAIQKVGNIPFGELIKGIGGLSAMLVVLAGAIVIMDEAKGGVAGLLAAAAGLVIMGIAIKTVGSLDFGTLMKGILGLAAVLAVLAAASLVAEGIFLLGVALAAVGAAMMLFGAGIALAGLGFELMAKFGSAAMGTLTKALQEFIRQLPQFVSAFVEGLFQAAIEISNQVPKLVGAIEKVLNTILDAFIRVLPKVRVALTQLINSALQVLIDTIPQFVEVGISVIMGLMQGIRDNIGEFVTVVSDIVENFLDAFSEQMPELVESVTNFLATAFQSVAFGLGELMPKLMVGVGISFMEGFWTGLKEQLGRLWDMLGGIVKTIIGFFTSGFGIMSPSTVMADIGKNIILGLINGVTGLLGVLKTLFIEIPGKVLAWMGNTLKTLFNKGKDLIGGLITGILNKIVEVKNFYMTLGGKILGWIGNVSKTLAEKGRNFISGLYNGIVEKLSLIKNWFTGLGGKVVSWVGDAASMLLGVGKDLIRGLWGGISAMKDWVMDKVKGFAGSVVDGIKGFFGIHSPSRVFMEIGARLGEGFALGVQKVTPLATNSVTSMADNVKKGWEKANTDLTLVVSDISAHQPVITPVLDLSKVQTEAKKLDQMVSDATIAPVLSFANAQLIAAARNNQNGSDSEVVQPTSVTNQFEQNIYAPEPLSTADIYRQTKSQFALAKEELEIA